MIRTDVAYVGPDGKLTQAGWAEFRGQETKIAALEAADATEAANAPGNAPRYSCRAWVNFNGTGTVAIRSAGNVSSVTDLGVGTYRVNFTTAMPDVNYAAVATCQIAAVVGNARASNYLTTSVEVLTSNGAAATDADPVSLAVFR